MSAMRISETINSLCDLGDDDWHEIITFAHEYELMRSFDTYEQCVIAGFIRFLANHGAVVNGNIIQHGYSNGIFN